MATMTLRGLDEQMIKALKEKASREGVSVNATTLRLLREALSLEKRKRNITYSDIDHLAGTWSRDDQAEFERSTSVFEQVDKDLWG